MSSSGMGSEVSRVQDECRHNCAMGAGRYDTRSKGFQKSLFKKLNRYSSLSLPLITHQFLSMLQLAHILTSISNTSSHWSFLLSFHTQFLLLPLFPPIGILKFSASLHLLHHSSHFYSYLTLHITFHTYVLI